MHHSSASLHAAGLPGPDAVYAGALRRWYRRAYLDVNAIMSVVDTRLDVRRPATLRLRLGIEPAFHPRPEIARGDHVLYVGRLSREKGLRQLLEAAAASLDPWPLVLLGTGPMGDALRERTRQLGLGTRACPSPPMWTTVAGHRRAPSPRGALRRCRLAPHETFGLAALEAAACATPVVTAKAAPSASPLLADAVDTFRAGDSSADLLRAPSSGRAGARPTWPARPGWRPATPGSTPSPRSFPDLERLLGR